MGKWNIYLVLVQVKIGTEMNGIDSFILFVSPLAPQSIDY